MYNVNTKIMKFFLKKWDPAAIASGRRINDWIQRFMACYIADKKREDDLLSQFGTFWFYGFFVLGTILLFAGALADGAVIFSWVYDLTYRSLPSYLTAVLGAVIIQLLIGYTIFAAVYNLMAGNDRREGFSYMVGLCLCLAVLGLGSSLYLSKHSDTIAEVIAVAPDLANTDSLDTRNLEQMAALRRDQERELGELRRSHDEVIAAFREQLEAFDLGLAQKIAVYEDKNDLASVRYLKNNAPSHRAEFLALLTQAKRDKRDALSNLRTVQHQVERDRASTLSAKLLELETSNGEIANQHRDKVAFRGKLIVYGNFAINSLRALICVMFALFMYYVLKQEGLVPIHPPKKRKGPRRLTSPRSRAGLSGVSGEIQGVQSEWLADFSAIRVIEIDDLGTAKQSLRNHYCRRVKSGQQGTRDLHAIRYQALSDCFKKRDIFFQPSSKTGITFDPQYQSA